MSSDPPKTPNEPPKPPTDPSKPPADPSKPPTDPSKPPTDTSKRPSDPKIPSKPADPKKDGHTKDLKISSKDSPPKSPPSEPEPVKGPYKVIEDPDQYGDGPVFIYGGPWIVKRREGCWLEETTPLNVRLSGAFKKSYAYYSLKERTPSMLTRVIDVASKKQYSSFVNHIAKLKHDLITNKPYAKFTVPDDDETEKWNEWIDSQSPKTYFGNDWVFTECYVYRKIQEGIQLNNLGEFDPFEDVKHEQFFGNVEPMCVVAEKLMEYCQPKEDRAIQKNEWVNLLKISLWANRCDLSQSVGEKANLADVCPQPVLPFPKPTAKPKPLKKGKLPPVAPPLTDLGYVDPLQITLDLKPNLLADDSAKSFGPFVKRCTKIRNNIQKQNAKDPEKPEPNWLEMFPSGGKKKGKGKKKDKKVPPADGAAPEPKVEPPKIPCPAKMKVGNCVYLDIVCDNSGYELFSDICIAHWVISQGFVDKVRFHVKKYPWFVSDVTKKDFYWLVAQCRQARYSKDAVKPPRPPNAPPIKPNKDGTMPVQPPDFRRVGSEALNMVANEWQRYIDEGKFQVFDEDFWTYPHTFDKMKQIDPYLYRNLQFAAMILFKGDLNYRKLVGEKNCVPYTNLQMNLQGFMPAPLVALRTVKSETVCGLPKGRYEQLVKFDPEWMQKGNFGVISMCKKGEAFPKQPNMPCVDYGDTCYGEICPVHTDF